MKPSAELLDLGAVDYGECWQRQEALFRGMTDEKAAGTGDPSKAGYLILCEHPHVYTLGRSGNAGNLLVDEDFLRGVGASFHRIDRGGDITYHGPGQIVGYPILDLEKIGIGLRDYIGAIEQSVIETVAAFGITAGRIEGKAGVWVTGDHPALTGTPPKEGNYRRDLTPSMGGNNRPATTDAPQKGNRKICAIGVRSSRFITMHGFALNVATDLKWFRYINPCGFAGGAVTSMNAETGREIDPDEVKQTLRERIGWNMNINI